MRIVFMGTPRFAVLSLSRLLEEGHDVAAVVTQPDKPRGRGREVYPPPVKVLALDKGVRILQPENVNLEGPITELTALAPELIIVVAYGAILRKPLLSLPSSGCINLHASLLPRLRGVAPINWAIILGERVTGVTTMWMNEKVDAGEIIFHREVPILPEENAGELTERMAAVGSELLSETLKAVARGTAPRLPQDISLASYAPRLKKEDGVVDWSKDAVSLSNLIRGVTPWPGAQTSFKAAPLKILKAAVVSEAGEPAAPPDGGSDAAADGRSAPGEFGRGAYAGAPGRVASAARGGDARLTAPVPPGVVLGVREGAPDEAGIVVATGRGALRLVTVQPSGKRPMAAAEFARGRRLSRGDRFGS
ncbi:MAG: methionyl-tRNA formyltransferase [Candidatus Eisenbacteria bacterium]|nr:methionyl-tRNA formyltransferase [Candidatus Eisenbacteria bacterium]